MPMKDDPAIVALVNLRGLQYPSDLSWRGELWTDRAGVTRRIGQMDEMHVLNTGRFLYRQFRLITDSGCAGGYVSEALLRTMRWFLWELMYRGLDPASVKPETEIEFIEDDALPG